MVNTGIYIPLPSRRYDDRGCQLQIDTFVFHDGGGGIGYGGGPYKRRMWWVVRQFGGWLGIWMEGVQEDDIVGWETIGRIVHWPNKGQYGYCYRITPSRSSTTGDAAWVVIVSAWVAYIAKPSAPYSCLHRPPMLLLLQLYAYIVLQCYYYCNKN